LSFQLTCFSFLQDLACRNCGVVLGMRCDNAPEQHLLKRCFSSRPEITDLTWKILLITCRNQLFLKLPEISLASELTGAEATVSVRQTFPLIPPGVKIPSSMRRASTVHPSPRPQTPSFPATKNVVNGSMPPPPIIENKHVREFQNFKGWTEDTVKTQQQHIDRIDEERHRDMVNFKDWAQDSFELQQKDIDEVNRRHHQELEKFKTWAQEAIKAQQDDIDRIGSTVDRIERDMASFKDFMQEVRTDLTANRLFQENLKEVELPALQKASHNVCTDNKDIRQNLNGLRSEFDKSIMDRAPQVTHEELESLTDDVREVNRKANEVDGLRAELEYLKARLSSMEEVTREGLAPRRDDATATRPPIHDYSSKLARTTNKQDQGNTVGDEDSQSSVRTRSHARPPSDQEVAIEQLSLPKRKHYQLEDDQQLYEPPAKKVKNLPRSGYTNPAGNLTNAPKSPRVRFKSPVVISSDHSSPSLLSPSPDPNDQHDTTHIEFRAQSNDDKQYESPESAEPLIDEAKITRAQRITHNLRNAIAVPKVVSAPSAQKPSQSPATNPSSDVIAAKAFRRPVGRPRSVSLNVSYTINSQPTPSNPLLRTAVDNSMQSRRVSDGIPVTTRQRAGGRSYWHGSGLVSEKDISLLGSNAPKVAAPPSTKTLPAPRPQLRSGISNKENERSRPAVEVSTTPDIVAEAAKENASVDFALQNQASDKGPSSKPRVSFALSESPGKNSTQLCRLAFGNESKQKQSVLVDEIETFYMKEKTKTYDVETVVTSQEGEVDADFPAQTSASTMHNQHRIQADNAMYLTGGDNQSKFPKLGFDFVIPRPPYVPPYASTFKFASAFPSQKSQAQSSAAAPEPDHPLPSIERETSFAVVIPQSSAFSPMPTTPVTPNTSFYLGDERPFVCEFCGKSYKHLGRINQVFCQGHGRGKKLLMRFSIKVFRRHVGRARSR
jgi:hypothetical protein